MATIHYIHIPPLAGSTTARTIAECDVQDICQLKAPPLSCPVVLSAVTLSPRAHILCITRSAALLAVAVCTCKRVKLVSVWPTHACSFPRLSGKLRTRPRVRRLHRMLLLDKVPPLAAHPAPLAAPPRSIGLPTIDRVWRCAAGPPSTDFHDVVGLSFYSQNGTAQF